ncbi:MAG: hypothetical protein H7067_03240 [Burkholderiales bacterium]|nr:hypothetical protein [Opitutaceae bacterium]
MSSTAPTRVAYRNGILLDSSDFQQEQSYHRGQLARALARLHGFGTIAGLKVEHFAAGTLRPEDNQPRPEEELVVQPGIALDRAGRLIEVKSRQCLRLQRWFAHQIARPGAVLAPHRGPGNQRHFVGDLFLRFIECPQGLRPGFPEPAVDATDALVPSRTHEGFELVLAPRDCDPANTLPAVPAARFPAAAPADRRAALDAIYAAYAPGSTDLIREYPPGFPDATAVFLARVRLRLLDHTSTALERHASAAVALDDLDRPLAPPSDLLLSLLPD